MRARSIHSVVVSVVALFPIISAFAQSALEPHKAQAPRTIAPRVVPELPEGVAAGWWTQVQSGLARQEYAITWAGSTALPDLPACYQAPNRAHGLRTYFTDGGIRVVPREEEMPSWEWGLTLVALGRGDVRKEAWKATVSVSENRAEYFRGTVTEWYINSEEGLEQGFTVTAPPDDDERQNGSHALTLDLALSGTLAPVLAEDGQAVDFRDTRGRSLLHYGHLKVTDASGRELPARLEGLCEPRARGVRIAVEDEGALYPITVDPLATSPVWTKTGGQAGANFGGSLAAAGDVNNDGYGDVLVGAPGYDAGYTDAGAAWLFRGGASGLSASAWQTYYGPSANAAFGTSVATLGDVNGDGYSDFAIGAPGVDKVFVYFAWIFHQSLVGPQILSSFGQSVASAGDVNGDGYSDLLVGAPSLRVTGGVYRGAVYFYRGAPGGFQSSYDWVEIGDTNASQWQGLGHAVATAGDVNGDGYSDVLVTNPATSYTYLYYGSTSGLGSNFSWRGTGGWTAACAGDVNGDGYSDVILGEPGESGGAGAARFYLGSATGLGVSPTWFKVGGAANEYFGYSVATAGDVNGDGYSDVLVGVPGWGHGWALLYLGTAAGLSSGTSWEVGGTSGNYGQAVATAGDVNGDGYSDVLVGAPNCTDSFAQEGKAYCYLGSAAGLSSTAGWSDLGSQADAQYGFSVASAGDLDGDGYSDIVVGAPFYDLGQTDEGAAWVYYGSGTGPPTSAQWRAESNQTGSYFGRNVAGLMSVNGDGYSDLAVGASRYDDATAGGKVFVWYGSSSGMGSYGTPANADWSAQAEQDGALFGISVASAGDVNCDGYGDLIVGADYYDSYQTDEGAAFVWHGSPTGLGAPGTPNETDWMAESNQANTYFGASVSSAGDVNGDGCGDIIIGAPYYTSGATGEGVAYVWHGSPTGLGDAGYPGNADWSARSNQASAHFGLCVAGAGDVNGDGYGDVLVGAQDWDGTYSGEGKAYFFRGSSTGLLASSSWTMTGGQNGAALGTSVAGVGDVNGDGYADVAFGAPFYDNGQTDEGGAWVYHGTSAGPAFLPAWFGASNLAGARYGNSVAGAGDVNGDGYADFIVGAPRYTSTLSLEGQAYLYLGNEGLARPVVPRQLSYTSATPVDKLCRSDSASGFRLMARGHGLLGRSDVKLEWEVKGRGYLFNNYGRGQEATWSNSLTTFASLSEILSSSEGGLFHWRSRVRYRATTSPFQLWGRWLTKPWGGWNEGDILLFGDLDGDGVPDHTDNCPHVSNPTQADGDSDGVGDACDNCPAVANSQQEDYDFDGVGDACDTCTDTDGDGYGNPGYAANTCPQDNCPDVSNPTQADADNDGIGDACDSCTDTDGDGFGNPGYAANTCPLDNCPTVANPTQADADGDGIGDACDTCTDTDGDGYGNPGYAANTCPLDNCPTVSNPEQADADGDTFGDACDTCTDTDGDGFGDPGYGANVCTADNCPTVFNPGQEDLDADGIGDACDPDIDGDGALNGSDCMPTDPTLWAVPTVVRELSLAGKPTTVLTWLAPQSPGGTTVVYDVLVSSRPDSFAALYASCAESNGSDLTASDSGDPSAGTVFYYLVRVENTCGSNMGITSGGTPRTGRSCP